MERLSLIFVLLIMTFAGCTLLEQESELNEAETKSVKADSMSKPTQTKTAEELKVPLKENKPVAEIVLPNETEACDCEFLINWKFLGEVILSDSSGNKIDAFRNNSETENYLIGIVKATDSAKFRVDIQYALEEDSHSGFISRNQHIGVYLSNYSADTINVYENLTENMKYSSQLIEYDPSFFELVDCKKGWSKIAKEGKTIGWVMNQYICASPYTTCN